MSSSSVPNTRLVVAQTDADIVTNASEVDRAGMADSNYEHALKRAKTDATETALALENLVEGIQAVKRILEYPMDMEKYDTSSSVGESSDAKLVSKVSKKLVGVLGSELIGLLNAAQMTKGHAKLRVEDDTNFIQELHRAREFAHKLAYRTDQAETISSRLKEEKNVLVKEVRALRGDRRLLVKEVKSLRKMVQRTKQFDAWRLLEDHLRDATTVHESVLSNKTFKSRFAGIDPPGTKVTKDTDMQDRNNDDNSNRSSLALEKENNVQHAYFSRRESHENEDAHNSINKVLKYAKGNHKPVICTSRSKTTPKSISNSTQSKQRGLSFPTGISNSFSTRLGRFKNVLQEASDQMRYHDNNNREQNSHHEDHRRTVAKKFEHQTQQFPSPSINQKKPEESFVQRKAYILDNDNNDVSLTSTRSYNNCKLLDDAATKSTKSCSFEIDASVNTGGLNSSLNLSTSMISCSDDEMPNDLVLQISIDEGLSFLNSGLLYRLESTSSPPPLIITPESSPLIGQSTNGFLKPLCNPNILRTLAIPNGNIEEETRVPYSALKPRLRSSLVGL